MRCIVDILVVACSSAAYTRTQNTLVSLSQPRPAQNMLHSTQWRWLAQGQKMHVVTLCFALHRSLSRQRALNFGSKMTSSDSIPLGQNPCRPWNRSRHSQIPLAQSTPAARTALPWQIAPCCVSPLCLASFSSSEESSSRFFCAIFFCKETKIN